MQTCTICPHIQLPKHTAGSNFSQRQIAVVNLLHAIHFFPRQARATALPCVGVYCCWTGELLSPLP